MMTPAAISATLSRLRLARMLLVWAEPSDSIRLAVTELDSAIGALRRERDHAMAPGA